MHFLCRSGVEIEFSSEKGLEVYGAYGVRADSEGIQEIENMNIDGSA